MKKLRNSKKWYSSLITDIGSLLEQGRKQAYQAINTILVRTYWEIGKRVVEFEQHGKEKAEYGSALLENLSKDLKLMHGKGFSKSNLIYMRLFYLKYQKSETLSHQLSWSHYFELLKIEDDLERSFYEKQCIREKWSNRELKRQKNSALFKRLALSKDKKGIIELSKKGQVIENAKDLIKDPYVLEFLKNVDLVFYHRVLKCFVLIDLKINEVNHADIGQMNTYLNYFQSEECSEGDNPPIGIVLAAEKDYVEIQYALGGISNKLFVSKYQLYLPNKKELENQVRELLGRN